MFAQRARHGRLVPGHQTPGGRHPRRNSHHDGAGSQLQNATRGASSEQSPQPLCEGIPPAPQHNKVHLQLSCHPHQFVSGCSHTPQQLDTFWRNPPLLQESAGALQSTLCPQAFLPGGRKGAKCRARLSPRRPGVSGDGDDMQQEQAGIRRGVCEELTSCTKGRLCWRGEVSINPQQNALVPDHSRCLTSSHAGLWPPGGSRSGLPTSRIAASSALTPSCLPTNLTAPAACARVRRARSS